MSLMKQKKNNTFIKANPLCTHLFNILWQNVKYTKNISAAYQISALVSDMQSFEIVYIATWMSHSFHQTPLFFDSMTEKKSDLGIW